jgi:hypothetical protein
MFYVLCFADDSSPKICFIYECNGCEVSCFGSQLQVVWAGDAVGNSFKPSLNQTKPMQIVCIGLGLGLGNFARNQVVWFLVWEILL